MEIINALTVFDIRKRAMIEALEKSLGIVATACRATDVSRQSHYNWLRDDPAYKREVDAIQDIAIDFVESRLYELIMAKDTAATIFYLKCKAKKRGYVERTEVDNMGAIKITWTEDKTYELNK